jgi:NAD(P)-dependent dehydrogenase (short-subunit alcohol dehydrogenase family)/acyl dehydratase
VDHGNLPHHRRGTDVSLGAEALMQLDEPGNCTSVSFSDQDLRDFSNASGDRNPLHLSQEYSRRTPYGEPVVFGCLGAISCLGQFSLPAGRTVTSLEAEFLRPLFVGVSYRAEVADRTGGNLAVRLFDGSKRVLAVEVKTGPSRGQGPTEPVGASIFERSEAAQRERDEIVPGFQVSGHYACDPAALAALSERWAADPFLAAALCWSSYLVGMELPGEAALFSRLLLQFDGMARRPGRMAFRASVASFDSRFSQIRADVSLEGSTCTVAFGQYWSFIRPTLPDEEIDSTGVVPGVLAGRVAVVVGASRGLGAAVKRALEWRGAVVYSLSRSAAGQDARHTVVGDAADPEALRRLRQRVLTEQGRLDFLICNASPAILPLRLETNAATRIGNYVTVAISIALMPLCSFLELLNISEGCSVIISSTAVKDPVREWPHYIAAKQAIEALATVASLQYPRTRTLIVRPNKLLTTLTNTPTGNHEAVSPALFANRIAGRLERPLEPGQVEFLT